MSVGAHRSEGHVRIGQGEVARIRVGRVLEVLHPFFTLTPCPALEHNVTVVRQYLQALAHARLIDTRGNVEALIKEDHCPDASVCWTDVAEAGLFYEKPSVPPRAANYVGAKVVAAHTAVLLKAPKKIASCLPWSR